MGILNLKLDTSPARARIQAALDSMRAAHAERPGADLYNIAWDKYAEEQGRPNQAIYYYKAVDEGRVGFEVHIGVRGPNRSPTLHFKVSSSEWRVVRKVGPAPARRITAEARAALRERLPRVVEQAMKAAVVNGMPDGTALIAALDAMEAETIAVFRETAIRQTENHRTKAWYGVISNPLAESFRIVKKGSEPPTGT